MRRRLCVRPVPRGGRVRFMAWVRGHMAYKKNCTHTGAILTVAIFMKKIPRLFQIKWVIRQVLC